MIRVRLQSLQNGVVYTMKPTHNCETSFNGDNVQGMDNVVDHITKQATTLDQRDKQYKTPLQIARKYRQTRIVHLLKERLEAAGMVDTSGETSAPGRSARNPRQTGRGGVESHLQSPAPPKTGSRGAEPLLPVPGEGLDTVGTGGEGETGRAGSLSGSPKMGTRFPEGEIAAAQSPLPPEAVSL